jgi:hypothetical protein
VLKHVGRKEMPCAPSPSRRHCRVATNAVANYGSSWIEGADRGLDLENEIFVCANCGREQSLIVNHDHKMPHTKVA